jgi:hypothetical protein
MGKLRPVMSLKRLFLMLGLLKHSPQKRSNVENLQRRMMLFSRKEKNEPCIMVASTL